MVSFEMSEPSRRLKVSYVWLYNEHLPQKALTHIAPIDALKHWQQSRPDLFVKQVRNHPVPDN